MTAHTLKYQARLRSLAVAVAAATCVIVPAAPASAAPFVYVTDRTGGIVTAYDAATGALAPLRNAGLAGVNPIGVAVTPDGTSVYAVNAGDGSSISTISEYDVAADGSLAPKTPRAVSAGREALEIAVNPDGKAAYVANHTDDTISQYDIGPGGVLSPTIPATVATGATPLGIAVTPNGKSAYVTTLAGKVLQYSVGAGDTLTPKKPATVATGNGPGNLAASPDGKSLYVVDTAGNTVSQYAIAADGTLHPKRPATVATGNNPLAIAISPDSQSVYVSDILDDDIAQYAATANGLVLKTPETVPAGQFTSAIVVSPTGKNVFATDRNGDALFEYSGGNGPGTLAPLSPPSVPFDTPGDPADLAIGPTRISFRCNDVIRDCAVPIVPIFTGGGTTAVAFRATIVRAAPVGILVQQLVGHRRVLVGRVPFGLKRTGRLKIKWNLRVNGHKLRRGRYLITLRMFDRHQHLIALAHPVALKVT